MGFRVYIAPNMVLSSRVNVYRLEGETGNLEGGKLIGLLDYDYREKQFRIVFFDWDAIGNADLTVADLQGTMAGTFFAFNDQGVSI